LNRTQKEHGMQQEKWIGDKYTRGTVEYNNRKTQTGI
jgi:hypothetical protein